MRFPLLAAATLFAGLLTMSSRSGAENASAGPATSTWRDAPVASRAQRLEIASAATGRSYDVFVFVPTKPPPPDGYPVLYLLDGNASYALIAPVLELMDASSRPGSPAPGIVVGIGYPGDGPLDMVARAEDYTPPAADLSATGDASGNGQGGADRFLDFIENELKPRLAADFEIDPHRQTLFGHSYGGLFTLHTLFTRTGCFQRYVAASPSIWWNDEYILTEKRAWLAARPAGATAPEVVISVGSEEQTPSAAQRRAQRADLLIARRMVDNARDLAADLAAHGVPNEFFVFAQSDHGTARVPALLQALRIAFH